MKFSESSFPAWSSDKDVIVRITAPDEILHDLEISLNGELIYDLFTESIEKIDDRKIIFIFHIHPRYRMIEGKWTISYESEVGLGSLLKIERINVDGKTVRQISDILTYQENIDFITKRINEAIVIKNKIVQIANSVRDK